MSVQVKRRSSKGISTKLATSIQELNHFASRESKFWFECSEGEHKRLKSPKITQGPETKLAMELSSARKLVFLELSHGP